MAALVQTCPQETATITMLQTRPTSATGRMPSGQHHIPQYSAASHTPRAAYHGNAGLTGYRGGSTPIQQYAFQSTPNLNQTTPWQPSRGNPSDSYDPNTTHHRFPNQSYVMSGSPTGVGQGGSWDDSAIMNTRHGAPVARPQLAHSGSSQASFTQGATAKTTPDRYRRGQAQPANHMRSQSATLPTGNLPNTAQFYNVGNNSRARPTSFYASIPGSSSMDDMLLHQQPQQDLKDMRRRSVHNLDSAAAMKPQSDYAMKTEKEPRTLRSVSNNSAHSRTGSSESASSSRSNHSRPSSSKRSARVSTGNPSSPSDEPPSVAKPEPPKSVNVPPRGSSSDAAKRTLNPSPLSKPVTMANDSADSPSSPVAPAAASGNLDSPAAKQLAAINQKGGKSKSKTSRLRRAFSFGSAAEFRKAAAPEAEADDKTEPLKLHKEPTAEEAYDAEQARIAEAQEAAGIGSSIYGGRFLGGSTDNLSISSTASSASVMIRKMGRGMKKSTRSLAGLFRPKSVVGVPPADPLAPEGSQATVSMVTVEAEAQRVNVTAEPQSNDGFPHLERNSLDAAQVPEMSHERTGSSGTDSSHPRKSIVGGDRERAEVLAAVRKGILKRPGSSSPSVRPVDGHSDLPGVPAITDTPNSSAPSTPNDEAQGHRRTGSVALGNEDYFMTALRLRHDSRSAPGTPQSGVKRNATFSPRIVFYDTWPSQEYDRRGDVATCNRLTPMLAQQIKEELNTFKMEMEVHENSKIYTHFF